MRLLIVSYQKSGTHQIMPMIHDHSQPMVQVVDRSGQEFTEFPSIYQVPREPSPSPNDATINALTTFEARAFGHITYFPEYASATQAEPTKVLFNVRDPRDVIVAEYENIRRYREKSPDGGCWMDVDVRENGHVVRLFERDDPIADLIRIAARRWPVWLGWMEHDFVLTVRYEDLRLQPWPTVNKIFDWVQPSLIPGPEQLLKKRHPTPTNPTFRKGNVGDWKQYFSVDNIRLAKKLLTPIMDRLGYSWGA